MFVLEEKNVVNELVFVILVLVWIAILLLCCFICVWFIRGVNEVELMKHFDETLI